MARIAFTTPDQARSKIPLVDWQKFSSSVLIEAKRADALFTSSAVVIRRNVLLTAAHSVENITDGCVHLSHHFHEDNPRIKFKKVIIHPDYNKDKSNFENDIAIVFLEHNLPMEFRPVILAQNIDPAKAVVERIGFGGRKGKNTRTWTNPILLTITENAMQLYDAQSVVGDSGGPIYQGDELIGIHSTLEGKNKTYAVYVPFYYQWIQEHMELKEIVN
jgi:V8-like Glu-specific endopeptidase